MLICGLALLSPVPAIATPPIQVEVAFMEALNTKDTAASERLQKDLDLAIRITKDLLSKKLSSCGYALRTHTTFYDRSDLRLANKRAQADANAGTWMIIGPRRSDHYLALAKAAKTTPTISLMASASSIAALGPEHLSLSPSNDEMAKVAVAEAIRRIPPDKAKRYLSVVSKDCISCKDFAKIFLEAANQQGLKQIASIQVSGELPETAAIAKKVRELKPSFILLPNYSRTSNHLIATLQPVIGSGFFVGNDGWGDSRFGFISSDEKTGKANGFTVRGFPPVQEGLDDFPLGKTILSNARPNTYPLSGPSLAILRAMDGTADLLCKGRPKDADAFRILFRKQARQLLSAPWGVSIYDLDGSDIRFNRSVDLP